MTTKCKSFVIGQVDDTTYIEFKPCGVRSHNPNDIQYRYCAYCQRFFSDLGELGGGVFTPVHGEGYDPFLSLGFIAFKQAGDQLLGVVPYREGYGLCSGLSVRWGYRELFLYWNRADAIQALTTWDGEDAPKGTWKRRIATGGTRKV